MDEFKSARLLKQAVTDSMATATHGDPFRAMVRENDHRDFLRIIDNTPSAYFPDTSPGFDKGQRLTVDTTICFCDIAKCREIPHGPHCPDGRCDQRKVYERLREYEQADQAGCLLRTPVPIGTDIWIITSRRPKVSYPYHSFVKQIRLTWTNAERWTKEWGINAFSTQEAATTAMKLREVQG